MPTTEADTLANTEKLGHIQGPDTGVDNQFPRGVKLALLTAALCLSVFLIALDTTILATAIPKITDQFKSLDDVGWYGSACTTAATQLLFGKLYTFLPVKWVYVAAIAVFEIGSLVCGIAPNSNALIIGRAIAGLGSSGIFTGALVIVANTVPLVKRPLYAAAIGGMYGVASVAGPLMGGTFTDKVSWRWCFYVNLPLGGVTLAIVIFLFKMPRASQIKQEPGTIMQRLALFDPWGTLVFVPAIVSLLLALQWGGSKYAWKSARIIALLVLFGISTGVVVGIQLWKPDQATIPPRILKQRSIWSGSFYAFCCDAAFFILFYYLPIWFQAIHGVSAVHSGIDILPIMLSLILASIVAGGLITRVGYYAPFMIASSVIFAVGAGLVSTLKVTSSLTSCILYQIVCGVGVGLGTQQPLFAVQAPKDVPVGTAVVVFAQTMGGALFVSVAQSVFTNKLVAGLAARVPGVDPIIVLDAGATSLTDAVPPQILPDVLRAYNDAIVSTFRVSIAMAALSGFGALVVEWRSIKVQDTERATGT
ncbi:DHA14-like major facilitator [Mycena pura]|uniref:DHA14-like major facilitator n=1 Tax=Mycena pura TaxID=153505 RepID=A0AAD6V8U0_9AGAR|nr:DHA14-like major facilitator [Mycena pura]